MIYIQKLIFGICYCLNSGAAARRASEAAKALRQAKEEACQHQTAAASRFQETRRKCTSHCVC